MLSTAHRVLDGEMYYDKTARGHKIKDGNSKIERWTNIYILLVM